MAARIYLDYAATTPARDEAVAAMLPHLGAAAFNPSSAHAEGRAARAALQSARAMDARPSGARDREIVFTGGGSEADNLAIFGTARARRLPGAHVVTVATEHHAVLHAVEALREDGFEVSVLPVDTAGRLDPARFAAALRPQTILASVMLANNEVGTLQPVAELGRLCRTRGVTFHCDAVQAPGRVPLTEVVAEVDLLSLAAHKFYGPKGVGVLFVREGTALAPLILGGGQEAGLRAGTENVAGAAGLARALELAVEERPAEYRRLRGLRDAFEAELARRIPGTTVNGAEAERLPNISSVSFAGVDSRALLVSLDLAGIAVSAGSACAAGSTVPSHVLSALGLPRPAQFGTLRFSLGRPTVAGDLERTLDQVSRAVAAQREAPEELGTTHSDVVGDHARV